MSEIQKMNLASENLVDDRLDKLKELMPEVFTESGIDFDKLRLELGDEVDEGQERYAFTWPGKADAIRQSQTVSTATLRPCVEKSRSRDGEDGSFDSDNIYIEGDNLEVLKLLQRGYHGKVKMIYIDPPYNTGHDFVYKDKFGNTIENYKEQAGLANQSNADANGRYHSDWCSMMYPRLRLARELLRDDGIIFISIDDNEADNLAKICDELFPASLLNRFCWISNLKGRQIGGHGAAKCCESIYVIAKNVDSAPSFVGDVEQLKKLMPTVYKGFNYETLSDDLGTYVIKNELYNSNSIFNEETRPNLVFDIGWNPNTGDVTTCPVAGTLPNEYIRIAPHRNNDGVHKFHAWRWSREKVQKECCDLHFELSGSSARVYTKIRDYGITTLKDVALGLSTSTGVQDFSKLFNGISYFDYAKPVELIRVLIEACVEPGDVVMDFFSGSGTTAEAAFRCHIKDSVGCQWILVQLPEELKKSSKAFKDGYATLCDIGEERIRRAGNKFKTELEESNRQIKLGEESKRLPDIGFRVFELDDSGIERPEPGQLVLDVVKPDRTELDIVFEMMLKWGLELTLPVEKSEAAGYPIWSVACDELVCCMSRGLTIKALEVIADMEPRRVLILDSILDDTLKLNAVQIFKHAGERMGCEIELRTV